MNHKLLFSICITLLINTSVAQVNKKKYARTVKKTEKQLNRFPQKTTEDPLGYWIQDYTQTMDPVLKRPTPEVLFPLFAETNIRKRISPGTPESPWQLRGPNNVGGRTRALVIDPSDNSEKKVWAGGVTGGLWYNNDITNSDSFWRPVSNLWANLNVTSIAFDPNDPKIMYVGTGEGFGSTFSSSRGYGVFKSIDGGKTWNHLSATANYYYINDMIVRNESGSSVLYLATDILFFGGQWNGSASNIGLMRSTDGGGSFSNVMANVPSTSNKYCIADLELDANNRIWLGTRRNYALSGSDLGGGRILYSDDGTNFTLAYTQNTALTGRVELACAPSSKDTLYALIEAGGKCETILHSSDRGSNWTSLTEPVDADLGIPNTDFTRGQGWYNLILAVNPKNGHEVLVGGIDLFRSTNSGSTWTQISRWSINNANLNQLSCSYVHADQHAIAFASNGKRVIFGNDGGVFFSEDISNSPSTRNNAILERNNGYHVTQFYGGSQSATQRSNFMLAGSQDNGTIMFTQDGINDEQLLLSGDGGLNFIGASSDNTQVISYIYNQFWGTSNNWSTYTQLLNDPNTGKFINAAIFDSHKGYLYAGKSAGTVYVNALGNNASSAATLTFGNSSDGSASFLQHLKKSTDNKSRIYIGTDVGNLFWADDPHTGTPSFTSIGTGINAGNISCIHNHNQTTDTLLVTLSNYGINNVYISTNSGSSWTAIDGNLPNMPVHSVISNPRKVGEVLIATELGVYHCQNVFLSNPKWSPMNESMGAVKTTGLYYRVSDGQIMVTTHGRGVFTNNVWRTDSVALTKSMVYSNSTSTYGSIALFNGSTLRLDSSITVRNLHLKNGTIDLNGYRLTVTGRVYQSTDSSNYYIQAGTSASPKPRSELVITSEASQNSTIFFNPNANRINRFEIGNGSAAAQITLGNSLKIKGGEDGGSGPGLLTIKKNSKIIIPSGSVLTLESDTFNAGLSLSDPAKRAILCQGTGKFAIEREHYGARGWRLYSHPFNANIDLQQVADDIEVIGSGGTSEGFFSNTYTNSSAYWYDYSKADSTSSTDLAWTPFTSAKGTTISNNSNLWNKHSPILLFNPGAVRGSGAFSNPSSATYQEGKITLTYGLDSTGVHLNDGETKEISINVPDYVPSNGLVGYWPFNGNANDESGNGNHGTIQGSMTFSNDINGFSNQSVLGNGASSIELDPNKLPLGSQSRTISLHFKISDIGSLTNNIELFAYGFNSLGNRFGIMLKDNKIGTEYVNSANLAQWNADTNWHHLVVTFIKSTEFIVIYLDNSLILNSKSTTSINTTSCCSFIGALFGPINSFLYSFKGRIDDIAIWNRALTPSEITALYNGTATTKLSSKSQYYFITNPFTTPVKLNRISGLNSTNCHSYFYYWKQRRNAISNNFMPAMWQSELISNGNTDRDTNISIPAFGTILVKLKNPSVAFSIPESAKQLTNFNYIIGGAKGTSSQGLMFQEIPLPKQGPGAVEVELLINDSLPVDRLLVYDKPNEINTFGGADAPKYKDPSFANIYSITSDGKALSLDAQDITDRLNSGEDQVEILLVIDRDFNKQQKNLRLRIWEKHTDLQCYFKDSKTGNLTPAQSFDNIAVEFSESDASIHRYSLVFKRSSTSTEDFKEADLARRGKLKPEVTVYPNPAKDVLYVRVLNGNDLLPFEIFSITGVKVDEGVIQNSKAVKIKQLKPGVYIFKTPNNQIKFSVD